MLNPDHNTAELAAKFAVHQSLEIDNYLDPHFANELYEWLAVKMPENWWFASYKQNAAKGYKSVNNIQRFPKCKHKIEYELKKCYSIFNKGSFTYMFDRTMPHKSTCRCFECEFRSFLVSEQHLSFVGSIINQKLTTSKEMFASRFTSGQFLSPHHDLNKGKVGFVLNLTPEWKAEWGGLLHILEKDYTTLKKVIVPSFNKITLFTIPEGGGLPHFVSHVAPDIPHKRISYTGWLQ